MSTIGNSSAETLRSLAEALRSRDFRRYAGVMFLHAVGDTAHGVAILWLVYDSAGTALSVGFATAVLSGCRIVLSPLAGVLIDRVNRRSLLAGTQGVKAVIVGGFATAVLIEGSGVPLWLLYAVIASLGAISAVDRPLRKAFVRDVVSAGGLESAARLRAPVSKIGRIAGSVLAALLLGLSMSWGCFALNSAVSVAATWLVLRMPQSVGVVQRGAEKADRWVLGYLKCTPAVTVPLLLLSCFSLFAYNVKVVAQLMVDTQMHAGPGTFGLLMLALNVGKLCGSVAVVWLGHSKPGTACVLLAVSGLTVTPVAVSGDIYTGLVSFWLLGLTGGAFMSFAKAAMQVAVDSRLQGRMTAARGLITSCARAVGALLMGWTADTHGIQTALIAAGVATMCFACAMLVWLSRRSSRW